MKQNQILKKFKNDGFVIIKNFLKKEIISDILSEIPLIKSKVIKKPKKFSHKTKTGKFNSIHNINSFYKSGKIIDLSKNKSLLSLAKLILNDKPELRNVEFFLKPKKNKMKTPFHQDNFFWNLKDANGINIWIACSKANKENGGICYLKKSHLLGVLNHKLSFIKGTSQMIPKEVIKNLKFEKIYPRVYPGDLIIHSSQIIHGSDENKSNYDRVGMVFGYKGKKSKYDKTKLKQYKSLVKKNIEKTYKHA
jgi:hypothetical protein